MSKLLARAYKVRDLIDRLKGLDEEEDIRIQGPDSDTWNIEGVIDEIEYGGYAILARPHDEERADLEKEIAETEAELVVLRAKLAAD